MGDPQDGYGGIRWRPISTMPTVGAAESPAYCHPNSPIILLANDDMMRLETSVWQRGGYASNHIAYWFSTIAKMTTWPFKPRRRRILFSNHVEALPIPQGVTGVNNAVGDGFITQDGQPIFVRPAMAHCFIANGIRFGIVLTQGKAMSHRIDAELLDK